MDGSQEAWLEAMTSAGKGKAPAFERSEIDLFPSILPQDIRMRNGEFLHFVANIDIKISLNMEADSLGSRIKRFYKSQVGLILQKPFLSPVPQCWERIAVGTQAESLAAAT